MGKKLSFLSIILFMVICSTYLNAQIVIQGKVTDKQDNPLTGAIILISGTNYGTSTDIRGEYELEIKKLPSGTNTVEVKYVGYKTRKEVLQATSGRVTFDFKLEEDLL
ncbi:MAG: carboxypeptidase-like regulatory domain-containing protein, partial [Clostridiales bacterium]